MANDFSNWVQSELAHRQWTQADLIRSTTSRGYKINSAQLSRILSVEKEAGVEYVIAIAHGLGVAREVAFRARGWLPALGEDEEGVEFSQEVVEVTRDLERVPGGMRDMALNVVQAVVATFLATKGNSSPQS